MFNSLHTMLMIPDADARARLREVLAAIIHKGETRTVKTVSEAVEILKHDKNISVVFFASSWGPALASDLISQLASYSGAATPALVVTVDRQTSSKMSAIVDLYLKGADGFISEPYSTEQLRELLERVLDPKRERKIALAAKAYKSAQLLHHETVGLLDERWKRAYDGEKGGGTAIKELKRLSQSMLNIFTEHPAEYIKSMLEAFENVTPPATQASRARAREDKTLHPGAVVKGLMEQRGLNRERLLAIVRISPEDFDKLVAEQLSIDEAMARELSRILGKTSREWVQIQRRFDQSQAVKKSE